MKFYLILLVFVFNKFASAAILTAENNFISGGIIESACTISAGNEWQEMNPSQRITIPISSGDVEKIRIVGCQSQEKTENNERLFNVDEITYSIGINSLQSLRFTFTYL